MRELLDKYVDQFDENFPIMMLQGVEDAEVKRIIEYCLINDEPYNHKETDDNILY